MIEPASWIHPDRLHHERVVVHPFANRVPVPPRVRVFGEFSPIRPDGAPIAVPLIQVNHLVGGLHELDGPQFKKLHAREPHRITLVQWIIGKRGGDLSYARSRGLIGFECRQPQQACKAEDAQYLSRRLVLLRRRLLLLALLRHVPLFVVTVLGVRRRRLPGIPHPIPLRPRSRIGHGAERGDDFFPPYVDLRGAILFHLLASPPAACGAAV